MAAAAVPIIGAGLGALFSWLAGNNASNASRDAAAVQADAARYAADLGFLASERANQIAREQFAQTRSDQLPWMGAGRGALTQLNYLLGVPESTRVPGTPGTGSGLLPGGGGSAPVDGGGQTFQPAATPVTRDQIIAALNQQMPGVEPGFIGVIADSWVSALAEAPEGASRDQLIARMNEALPGLGADVISQAVDVAVSNRDNSALYEKMPSVFTDGSLGTPETFEVSPNTAMAPGGYLAEEFKFGAGDLDKSPGYQFRMEEGRKALEGSAAARGMLKSGGTLKALTRYSQGVASDEWDREYSRAFNTFNANRSNLFNRLAAIAGVGQTATTQLGAAGQDYASTLGANLQRAAAAGGDYATQAANARASGYVGGANAWSDAVSGGINNAANMYKLYLGNN